MTDPATTHAAYARCQSIVQTSGSSFAAGIRLLPAPKRRAITAIYALARRIDDIADGGGSDADRIAALAAERDALAGVGPGGDLVHIALADAAARFPLPLEEFGILIDGAEADVRNDGHETFDDLERYCRQVAGSIGRLSLAVFGCSDPVSGATLADELGVGLQIANIVRDLREDAQVGRVYLPRADLARFDCSVGPRSDGHRGVEFVGPIDRVVRYEAFRALERLTTGLGLTTLLDRRSASCVIAMAGKYRRLLERIVGDPGLPLRGRLELRGWEKGLIVAESLAGRR